MGSSASIQFGILFILINLKNSEISIYLQMRKLCFLNRPLIPMVGRCNIAAKGKIITDSEYLAARQGEVINTIERVADFLRNQNNASGLVASAGFCFGARNTYVALAEHAHVDAGLAFYPTPKLHQVFDEAKAASINKPMMFVYAGQDGYISAEEKRAMRDAAQKVIRYIPGEDNPHVEYSESGNGNIVTLAYSANDHGFNRRDSKYSDSGASEHALQAASDFLNAAFESGDIQHTTFEHAETKMPQSVKYLPEYKV